MGPRMLGVVPFTKMELFILSLWSMLSFYFEEKVGEGYLVLALALGYLLLRRSFWLSMKNINSFSMLYNSNTKERFPLCSFIAGKILSV